MEQLYKEMQERLRYLEAQEQTEEIKWRISEMTLSIVRVQQLLLANVSRRSEQLCQYEKDDTTAMNCKHCGKAKWLH